jgi:hypothetical protein
MKRAIFLVILLFAVILPFSANADTVTMVFTGVNGNTVQDFLKSGNPSYYIDPYLATVNGVGNTQIWCVDDNHMVNFNDSWTANVTLLGGGTTNTYLKDMTLYQEMAYLVSQFGGQNLENQRAMQWVIWDISTNKIGSHGVSYTGYSDWATVYNYWLAQAQANYGSVGTGWEILTDTAGNKQEFITRVPEPGILILLGIALSSVGLAAFRRKKID